MMALQHQFTGAVGDGTLWTRLQALENATADERGEALRARSVSQRLTALIAAERSNQLVWHTKLSAITADVAEVRTKQLQCTVTQERAEEYANVLNEKHKLQREVETAKAHHNMLGHEQATILQRATAHATAIDQHFQNCASAARIRSLAGQIAQFSFQEKLRAIMVVRHELNKRKAELGNKSRSLDEQQTRNEQNLDAAAKKLRAVQCNASFMARKTLAYVTTGGDAHENALVMHLNRLKEENCELAMRGNRLAEELQKRATQAAPAIIKRKQQTSTRAQVKRVQSDDDEAGPPADRLSD